MNIILNHLETIRHALDEKAASDANNTAVLIELIEHYPKGYSINEQGKWETEAKLTLAKIVGSQVMVNAQDIVHKRR